jgi:hypothetical protein
LIKSIYVIGSLRNPNIPEVAEAIRARTGIDVFDDWHAFGPESDDHWQRYETYRGSSYYEALRGRAARNAYSFDKHHLDRSDAAVLVLPAGKSAHLEIGYMVGQGKRTFVLFPEEPERWDVMYQFVDEVFFSLEDFLKHLEIETKCKSDNGSGSALPQSLSAASPTLEYGYPTRTITPQQSQ